MSSDTQTRSALDPEDLDTYENEVDEPGVGDGWYPQRGSGRAEEPAGLEGLDTTDEVNTLDDGDPLEALEDLEDLDDLDADEGSSSALFAGDDGRLELAQRKALVVIIKKRFVTAVADAEVWKTITADPQILRSRLHDLFMDLHIDLEREIAFKRQVHPEGEGRFPTLLHDNPWGREETIVLVYLRGRFRNEQVAGNSRVFVERQEIFEAVESHRPSTATDHAADRKRVVRAIEALAKAGLLIGAAHGDRFEVSAAIEVILPVEKLRELHEWLRQESATESDVAPGEPGGAMDDAADATGVEQGERADGLDPDADPADAAMTGADGTDSFDRLTFDDEQENPA